MPKKNQQNKPNGFVIYANEIRNDLLREGYVIRSMPDLISAASPKWQNLPADEREYYKDRAKWEWENRNGTGSQHHKKPVRPDTRRDCTGAYIDGRVDLIQVNEEKRKKERTEVFLSWPAGRAVMEKNFYFVSFICLLEEPFFQPIEVAAVEFNLLGGIVRHWHKYINPGHIELGYQYLAQQISESTHKLPIEGIAEPGDTYTSIYDELLSFLSRGATIIPPVHVKILETDKVEGCIKWLARMAGRPHQLKRIYELEGLILDLDFHLKGQPQDFFQSKQMGTQLISSTIYDWDSNSKCQFHVENETRSCAKGNVFKYSYLIANYFCLSFNIPTSDGHTPMQNKAKEECYTYIKGAKPKSQGRTKADEVTSSHGEDIARQVAEKLKIEEENRNFQEEEADRREIEIEQRKLEEKKRWLSLRGAADNEESAPPPAGVQVNQMPQPSFGRGRGRGAANILYSLRKPGDRPENATTTGASIPAVGRAFGRGTRMYTGN